MIESAPYVDDFGALARAATRLAHSVLLVSSPRTSGILNRYAVFAAEPTAILSCKGPESPIELIVRNRRQIYSRFDQSVEAALSFVSPSDWGNALPWSSSHLPFTGGLIGFVGYDFGGRFERMPSRKATSGTPSLWFGSYPVAYVADQVEKRAWWVGKGGRGGQSGSGGASNGSVLEKLQSCLEIAHKFEPVSRLSRAEPEDEGEGDWRADWEPSLDQGAYARAVKRTLHYLRAGDVYQVNLTVRHRRKIQADPAELFGQLIHFNPAPYSAFLRGEEWAIMSSSPELLLDSRSDGEIQTRPIKGTAPRSEGLVGIEYERDARRLMQNEKNRAEHLMIVDLERNDLGKICRYGSVRVDPLIGLESYTGLHHLVSGVQGQLRPGVGSVEAMAALFPGGSVTGAPKIRAMEIIHELETVPRGVYTGAIGWITPRGESRFNLAIRTLVQQAEFLDLHTGGAIVADSDPTAEAEECGLKGSAMAKAVEAAFNASKYQRPVSAYS